MDIISVMFQNKTKTDYAGREYSYRTDIPVNVGDVVLVPVKNGTAKARVVRVNIKDSEFTFNPASLKTIEALAPEGADDRDQTDGNAMNTAIMKNWSVTNIGNGFTPQELLKNRLQGDVYEDSRRKFPDGTPIITTPIQEITNFTTHKVVITNKTEYKVFPDDVDPKYEETYPGAFERLQMVSNKQ